MIPKAYLNGEFDNESLELFERSLKGDFVAYGDFFEKHIDFVLHRFKNDHRMEYDDLRQEMFIKTYLNIPKIENVEDWSVLCRKCANGLLNNAKKKNKPCLLADIRDEMELGEVEDHSTMSLPEYKLLNAEAKREILLEVNKLSLEDQHIFFLRYCNDLSLDHIAEIMNIPKSTVADRMNKIEKMLSKSTILQSLSQYGLIPASLHHLLESGKTVLFCENTAKSKGIFSILASGIKWCFSFVGMIFAAMLWLTSCLILGTKGMAEFGKSAYGTRVRVAFIRYCFIGYLLMMLYPVIHRTLVVYIPLLLTDYWPKTTSRPLVDYGTNLIGLFLFIGYIIYARVRFRRLQVVNSSIETSNDEMDQTKCRLRRFVNIGSLLVGINVVFFCFFYLLGLYTVPLNSVKFLFAHNTWDSLVPGLICFGGYHLFSWKTFSNLVSNIDREYSPDIIAKSRRNGVRFLTAAGIVFTLTLPFLGMIMSETKRMPDAILFFSFLFVWLIFIKWNHKRMLIYPIPLLAIIIFVLLHVIARLLGW